MSPEIAFSSKSTSPRFSVWGMMLSILWVLTSSSVSAAPELLVEQILEKDVVGSGDELNGSLRLRNSGDEALKIRGVSSSCGCTTLRLNVRNVPVGGSILLEFVVDTRGKLGRVEKTITLYTNDPDSPHIETVHFHALPSGMGNAAVQAVFEPPCAECHINSGTGKSGQALYDAVCVMCHPEGKFQTRDPDALQIMISAGNFQIGMPGYGEFLTEAQVQSLLLFLSRESAP